MDVGARRVRAFRAAAHGLARQADDPIAPLHGWAVQDSPPGAAVAALAARGASLTPGWLDAAIAQERSVAALYNARTATALVPAGEVAAYATAMLPADDAGLQAILGRAVPDRREDLAEPVEVAVSAVSDALDGAVLSRDDLHEALRRRLPPELLPWCEGCRSHHARRGLLVLAGLHGRLCIAGRAGRQPKFARTDQWLAWVPPAREDAGAELVRRYLSGYGPSTPAHFAEWAGLGGAHARELWGLVAGELTEVRVDGRASAWLLARDTRELASAAPAPGVRLLPPGDPLLLGRDRETILPDAAARARVWRAIGGAGVVLADGEPVATWRARKQGRTLAVTVEAFATVAQAAVEDAAARLAPLRGCSAATVGWA